MSSRVIEAFRKILGDDPVFSIRAAMSPLFIIITWQEKVHPLAIMCVIKARDMHIAANEKEYIAIAVDKFTDYFHKKISLAELVDDYNAWEEETQALYEEIVSTDLSSLSDSELQEYVHRVNKVFVDMANKTVYIENVDYDKILAVIGPTHKEQLDAIWERATESAFMSFEGRLLKKLIDIVSAKSGNEIREAKFIYSDYFWTKSEAEIATALEGIKEHLDEKKEEFKQMELLSKKRAEEHDAWLGALDPESRMIAEYAQLVMRMRDTRKDPIAQIQAALAELSVEMVKRAGVDPVHAPYVLIYEYMKGVEYLASMKADIEKRKEGCVYLANADQTFQTEVFDFEEASAELHALIEHKVEKTDTLKGQIACKGNVTGVVRVIFDPHDDKGFQPGDILVTSMTRPEFVPIMKIAGAVVTNEGGITCHAAIVSRELKKPCVIGTKIATQVLKDGDMVEVDADTGVIKILGKREPQKFIKQYTRNFSIIMQEAWFHANTDGFLKKLGLTENPHSPPYIYFMRGGVEEVWENVKANEWLYEKLSERLESDPEFFPALHKRYFEQLADLETWWKKDISTAEELNIFVEKVFAQAVDFVLMYGATLSESLPPEQQRQGDEFRQKDVFFSESNSALVKALHALYPELGYLSVYVTREELGKEVTKEELQERDNGFVLIPGIFQGAIKFDQLIEKFPEYSFEIEKGEYDTAGLKGQAAFKGRVSGTVRIVKRTDQVSQVQEGDIIVSPMTTPDMFAGMKLAAAFVTDEGGITCHAAIIAREMKKPCVIGTKIATQVLKDGDEVEVDATNGVVRILK